MLLLLPPPFGLRPCPAWDNLPRPSTPPPEIASPVPAQMQRWREEAQAAEHGEGGVPRDPVRAAQLYCRAARYGDALAQFNLAWMLTKWARHRAR